MTATHGPARWAPWCGPCQMISPVLERLAGQRSGHMKLVKVNVDENQDLARRYSAMSTPLLVLIETAPQGRPQGRSAPPSAARRLDRAATGHRSLIARTPPAADVNLQAEPELRLGPSARLACAAPTPAGAPTGLSRAGHGPIDHRPNSAPGLG